YTNLPLGMTNVIAVSAGDGFSMVARGDGSVLAWGTSSFAVTNVPAAVSNAIAIAAGSGHALALLSDGRPLITRQPVGGTSFVGRDFTLRPTVTGLAPLSYQWQMNGADIADATNATLVLPNLGLANAGNYQLVVSNALAVATSVAVPLTVLDS